MVRIAFVSWALFLALPSPVHAALPTPGVWVVADHQVLGTDYAHVGDIRILAGGTLEVRSATLTVDGPFPRGGVITVERDGLLLLNGSLDRPARLAPGVLTEASDNGLTRYGFRVDVAAGGALHGTDCLVTGAGRGLIVPSVDGLGGISNAGMVSLTRCQLVGNGYAIRNTGSVVLKSVDAWDNFAGTGSLRLVVWSWNGTVDIEGMRTSDSLGLEGTRWAISNSTLTAPEGIQDGAALAGGISGRLQNVTFSGPWDVAVSASSNLSIKDSTFTGVHKGVRAHMTNVTIESTRMSAMGAALEFAGGGNSNAHRPSTIILRNSTIEGPGKDAVAAGGNGHWVVSNSKTRGHDYFAEGANITVTRLGRLNVEVEASGASACAGVPVVLTTAPLLDRLTALTDKDCKASFEAFYDRHGPQIDSLRATSWLVEGAGLSRELVPTPREFSVLLGRDEPSMTSSTSSTDAAPSRETDAAGGIVVIAALALFAARHKRAR